MLILTLLVLAFFFFFGCAYEFITYYLNYQKEQKLKKKMQMNRPVDHSDSNEYINTQTMNRRRIENHRNNDFYNVNNINQNNNFNYQMQDEIDNEDSEKCDNETICICVLLGILGFGLQPLYLMFYLLVAMMECYRRFACWYFYF